MKHADELQDIVVKSAAGTRLNMRVLERDGRYRIEAEYMDKDGNSYPDETTTDWVGDLNALFSKRLAAHRDVLKGQGDTIARIENPCNTPFITAPQQEALARELGIAAEVTER